MTPHPGSGRVVAVSSSQRHGFSKQQQASILLLAGRGVEGDAHCGETVQHRYLKQKNPLAPNRMQVHLLPLELLDELSGNGFNLVPGQFGENITTREIDLHSLPLGTHLHLGKEAVLELTGLRTPCKQIENFRPGLLRQVQHRDGTKVVKARAGVMAIVLVGGLVEPGAPIEVTVPPGSVHPMQMI